MYVFYVHAERWTYLDMIRYPEAKSLSHVKSASGRILGNLQIPPVLVENVQWTLCKNTGYD